MLELSYCGWNCDSCERYIATKSGDRERLRELAVLWKNLGWRDEVEPPEKMACPGCHSAYWCRFGLRERAIDKGVVNCGWCEQYPCERVETMLQWAGTHAERMKADCSKEEYERLLSYPRRKRQSLDKEHEKYLSRLKSRQSDS